VFVCLFVCSLFCYMYSFLQVLHVFTKLLFLIYIKCILVFIECLQLTMLYILFHRVLIWLVGYLLFYVPLKNLYFIIMETSAHFVAMSQICDKMCHDGQSSTSLQVALQKVCLNHFFPWYTLCHNAWLHWDKKIQKRI
jgi:hypothetical protein